MQYGMGAGALIGAQQYTGDQSKQAYEAQRNAIAQPQPAPTLTRAASTVAELNKRLGDLTSRAHALACAIGGPFPIGKPSGGDNPKAASAMGALNDDLDT